MNVYGVSAFLLVVLATVSAQSQEELLKKMSACAQATNWSKEHMEEVVCRNPIPNDPEERRTFLTLSTCMWQTCGVIDSAGKVHAENVKYVVPPSEGPAAIALIEKCDPGDDNLSVEQTVLAINQCYRDNDNENYVRNCISFTKMLP